MRLAGSVHDWRQALGLCKWLCRGSGSFSELTAAAARGLAGSGAGKPPLADQARASSRNYAIDSKPPEPDHHRPPGVAHFARVSYSAGRSGEFVNGYLVGLSKELRPLVEKHIAWMESEPEPDLVIYTEQGFTYEGWLDSVHDWRQALGVCKWLCRGSRSFSELTAAAAADWQVLELASPPLADQARASRRNYMDEPSCTGARGRCAIDRTQNL